MASALPKLPAGHNDLISYIAANPDKPMSELMRPYREYDAALRSVYAQDPKTAASIFGNHVNNVPLFDGKESDVKIRARNLDAEPKEEQECYIMPLDKTTRKPKGAPAIVESLSEFQTNFNIFSESSLTDFSSDDWNNVVAAGSSVVTPLLPVPKKFKESKRTLRQYYHDIFAPASDVDLFLYGLSEKEALDKIKLIEAKVRNCVLSETTTVRTKHAITIVSQYPTRHIQIVLRIYKSISEILTGFDVDCSCAAFDGTQVYVSPRALAAYMTQLNTVDLTRRSPSYENRLSKYSHRGFEVYWPDLDRSRIDPTIFERSFKRTVGLARLLVLEKMPTQERREKYQDQRRRERGRPPLYRSRRQDRRLAGNLKQTYEDEVAEWEGFDEDVSDYHTFSIPYGPKYTLKRIEKLLYTKDYLLNAEWNKSRERKVNLHRHPVFFGSVEDVIHDCCGFCPKPCTPEEKEVAEEEAKIYISGDIAFIKDDPGRQSIGSFNPITGTDWTEMAFVGNTTRLCQAIIDHDLEHVEDWLSHPESDVNCRDYTGRTPLQLAVMSSSPEIVKCLIDRGARLVARMADGRTALHLAAERGNVEMIRLIMDKSEQNEEEEARRSDARNAARRAATGTTIADNAENVSEGSGECIDDSDDEETARSTTTGSFVKVDRDELRAAQSESLPLDKDEPDFYDINVAMWDNGCSALHLAIANGHVEAVQELVKSYGADILLSLPLFHPGSFQPYTVILNLCLALKLPTDQAKTMFSTLLRLGASAAQADKNLRTAFEYISCRDIALVDEVLETRMDDVKRVLNNLSIADGIYSPCPSSPLLTAIHAQKQDIAFKLLEIGAKREVTFDDFVKSFMVVYPTQYDGTQHKERLFAECVEQPIVVAVGAETLDVAMALLRSGVAANVLTAEGRQHLRLKSAARPDIGYTLLELVRLRLDKLRDYEHEPFHLNNIEELDDEASYLNGLTEGTYSHWAARIMVQEAKKKNDGLRKANEKKEKEAIERKGVDIKKTKVKEYLQQLELFEKELILKGAKTFDELYPDHEEKPPPKRPHLGYRRPPQSKFKVEFNFRAPALTDTRRDGYIRLFEAAWSGDLRTVKELTLGTWGKDNDQPPLKIAVEGSSHSNPLSLAILRGYYVVAKGILEIAQAQYLNQDQGSHRFRYVAEPGDDFSDVSSVDEADDGGLGIYRELVDDQYTIENIGEVSKTVKSTVSPVNFLNMGPIFIDLGLDGDPFSLSKYKHLENEKDDDNLVTRTVQNLVQFATWIYDMELLRFILDLGADFQAREANAGCVSSRIFQVSEADLEYAMKLGRTAILAEMLRRTGAGVPLQNLLEKSGVEVKKKPQYYCGLTVRGRKRTDWAESYSGSRSAGRLENSSPPLLRAARNGNLDSVIWFSSDAPMRYYREFVAQNKSDERLKDLSKTPGGIENLLSTWLATGSELVIHCAILSQKAEGRLALLEHLVKTFPEFIEARSSNGYTPLLVAFKLGCVAEARCLIEAGANQACRNKLGNNLVREVLGNLPHNDKDSAEKLREMLSMLDREILPSLLMDRHVSSRSTPLSGYIDATGAKGTTTDQTVARTVKVLLNFSPDANELRTVDGGGDTPAHLVVRFSFPRTLRVMLERDPEILMRENSTGRTPVEMARDFVITKRVTERTWHPYDRRLSYFTSRIPYETVVSRSPESFVEEVRPNKGLSPQERVLGVCEEMVTKLPYPRKRRMVTLAEANEVARRLASTNSASRVPVKLNDSDSESSGGQTEVSDADNEVDRWISSAPAWVGWKSGQ